MPNLEITTRTGCSCMCEYCPQTTFIKQYTSKKRDIDMTMETFVKCLDNIPREVDLHFTGYVEPFLNKRRIEFF